MKTKTMVNVLIAVCAIGSVVWKLAGNKQEMEEVAVHSMTVNPTVPVRVDKVRYADVNSEIAVDGCVHAGNEVTLYSKVQGIVLKKYKKTGDRVDKGTVVAQVENSVVKEALRLAEMNLANAGSDVERYKKLAEANAVTQREYEAILITHREAQQTVIELQEQLANTTLVSPVHGILETGYFEEGALLSVGTQVADFVDASSLKAVINVTENEVYRIKKGNKASLTTDVLPDVQFEGTVDVVASKGNTLLNYPVEIRITGRNAEMLKPGMYISSRIITENLSLRREMLIDRKAIIESLKTPEVYIIREGKAFRQKISTGSVHDNYVVVTGGLADGDQVVVAGQINLTDGRSISIIK